MTTRRQQLVLGVLIAVLVVVLVPFFLGGPAERPAAPSNPAGAGARQGRGEMDVNDVRLELLKPDHDGIVEPERNPFRFQAKAPPPRPPSAARPAAPPPEFAAPPAPAGPPPPPPIPLRFVGIVAARGGGRAAALTDGRGNNFLAREGDIIEGRYTLLRLGPDSVELAYLDGRGRQTIRLSGQ